MAQDYLDAFPDLHIELISLYVDGSTVLQEWRTTGTHSGELMGIPATGRRAETIGAGVDRFGEDGLVDPERGLLGYDQAFFRILASCQRRIPQPRSRQRLPASAPTPGLHRPNLDRHRRKKLYTETGQRVDRPS
jgi:SnoaL-like polyketide cyclase